MRTRLNDSTPLRLLVVFEAVAFLNGALSGGAQTRVSVWVTGVVTGAGVVLLLRRKPRRELDTWVLALSGRLAAVLLLGCIVLAVVELALAPARWAVFAVELAAALYAVSVLWAVRAERRHRSG